MGKMPPQFLKGKAKSGMGEQEQGQGAETTKAGGAKRGYGKAKGKKKGFPPTSKGPMPGRY